MHVPHHLSQQQAANTALAAKEVTAHSHHPSGVSGNCRCFAIFGMDTRVYQRLGVNPRSRLLWGLNLVVCSIFGDDNDEKKNSIIETDLYALAFSKPLIRTNGSGCRCESVRKGRTMTLRYAAYTTFAQGSSKRVGERKGRA